MGNMKKAPVFSLYKPKSYPAFNPNVTIDLDYFKNPKLS